MEEGIVELPQSDNQLSLVSIITPTYNHENYIGACLDSVLRQTYENWEQIIIDDGSTDRTAEIIRNYSDQRIHYFCQNNAGIEALAHNYNRALEHCRGTLIAILEGDDMWPPQKLASMVNAFSDPSVVLAYGEMREIDPQGIVASNVGRLAGRRRKLSHATLNNDPVRSAIPYMLTMGGHSLIPASTVLIRRTALDAIGGFQYVPGQLYTDYPTFIMLALRGKFHFFSEVMGYRRFHVSSATAQFSEEMTDRAEKHLSELLEMPEFKLSASEQSQVQRSWRSAAAGGKFRHGRRLLLEQKWAEARKCFREAFQLTDIRIAMGSAVGWCFSWFQCDLESLFRRAGRPALRSGS